MKRDEERVLRDIERRLESDDPALAEILGSARPDDCRFVLARPWPASMLAGTLLLLGVIVNDDLIVFVGILAATVVLLGACVDRAGNRRRASGGG